jgi:hypothetical protein
MAGSDPGGGSGHTHPPPATRSPEPRFIQINLHDPAFHQIRISSSAESLDCPCFKPHELLFLAQQTRPNSTILPRRVFNLLSSVTRTTTLIVVCNRLTAGIVFDSLVHWLICNCAEFATIAFFAGAFEVRTGIVVGTTSPVGQTISCPSSLLPSSTNSATNDRKDTGCDPTFP